jgi:hypothetical protein
MPVKDGRKPRAVSIASKHALGGGAGGLRRINPIPSRSLEDEETRAAISFRGLLTPLIGPIRVLSLGDDEDLLDSDLQSEVYESTINQALAPRKPRPFDLGWPSHFAVWLNTLLCFATNPLSGDKERRLRRRWAEGEAMLLSRWSRSFSTQKAPELQRINLPPRTGAWESYLFQHLGSLNPRQLGGRSDRLWEALEEVAGVRALFDDIPEKRRAEALKRTSEWVKSIEEEETGYRVDDSDSPTYAVDIETLLHLADSLHSLGHITELDPFLVIDQINGEYRLEQYELTEGAQELLWSAQVLCRST